MKLTPDGGRNSTLMGAFKARRCGSNCQLNIGRFSLITNFINCYLNNNFLMTLG